MRGDEHDFEGSYAAVFDQLVGQLFLVTGNLQDAEDTVQEALTGRPSAGRGRAATASPGW